MGKKIENILDYVTAADAAAILSQKHGRPIRSDYISKMSASKKHVIRAARFGRIQMYHRADIESCTLGQKRTA
jgi:hypothetical protein